MATGETSAVEFKEQYDPDSLADRLHLVKEIVAMSNATGGEIHLGVSDGGSGRPGLDKGVADALEPARLSDMVYKYVAPDHLEVTVERRDADRAGRVVVCILVPRCADPPLVFSKQGECEGSKGKQTVFRQHGVYRRKGTKAEPASRQDFRDWIAAAVAAERDRWRSRVALLSSLPDGAVLQIRAPDGEAVEEPGSHLRRAVAQYRDDPTKLLSGRDLLAAFIARAGTTFDESAYELLIQSALRRRPTLFLWLALAEPSSERACDMLKSALSASDRDKSDAGRSIIDISALYLDDESYDDVLADLASSRYAHFREAAEAGRDRGDVLRRLGEAHRMNLDGSELGWWSDQHLLDVADRVARGLLQKSNSGASRRLSALGSELLLRRAQRPAARPPEEGVDDL